MSGRTDPVYMPTGTFAAGQPASNAVDISKVGLRGMCLIGNWSDWTAAQIGVQISYDGGETFGNMWKINAAGTGYDPVACPNPASLADNEPIEVPVQAWMLENATHLRLVSRDTSTYATPVNQVSEIAIKIGTLA